MRHLAEELIQPDKGGMLDLVTHEVTQRGVFCRPRPALSPWPAVRRRAVRAARFRRCQPSSRVLLAAPTRPAECGKGQTAERKRTRLRHGRRN